MQTLVELIEEFNNLQEMKFRAFARGNENAAQTYHLAMEAIQWNVRIGNYK